VTKRSECSERLAFDARRRHRAPRFGCAQRRPPACRQHPRCHANCAVTRAHEKSRTSTRRFTGPLHFRCATWANRSMAAACRAGGRSRTGLFQCGVLNCHLDAPAWRCCVGSTWFLESPSARSLRSVTHHVDRVGFEPTFCLGKSQVQSGFATDPSRVGWNGANRARAGRGDVRHQIGPTLWNRTRTSRASAERADQLRESGYERRASS
jgi:hypothetical protein